MFKLDRLVLRGFKSFVDAESLDFSGGMTAIVGPNGCGKSNVCDAVCWVLGERSAKSLRGEKMEDVIFSGSANRGPLGLAEVELTLTTESSIEHAEDGRLTIGRRIHRSGESNYLLNGRSVRLKDVRSLLMDTGLGIRAYSVIEQGKIGMILSGKPQERRRLLEEAAGITRYKDRRRVAELKLEEARANLSRLDDVVSEVERRLRSLKRQAGAARRFKKRKERFAEVLAVVLLGRWSRLAAERRELAATIDAATEREAAELAKLEAATAELARGREELDGSTRGLAEEHAREAELAATIEGKQEFLKGARHRRREIADRISSGNALAVDRRRRLGELDVELAGLGETSENLTGERDSAADELTEEERRIGEVENRAARAEAELETLRGRLLQSIGGLNGLRNRLHREQVEREKGDLRRTHLSEELAEKLHELQQAARDLEEATSRHSLLERQARTRGDSLDLAEETCRRLNEDRDRLAAELRETQSDRSALEQRRNLLHELDEAQTERRQRVEQVFAEAGLPRPAFLTDQVELPAGWETSLDFFLGRLADAVVLPPGEEALDVAGRLTAGGAPVRLIESDVTGLAEPREPEDPAIVSSLAEALGLDPALVSALPRAYLVESRGDARRLARRFPGIAFISRERLWAQAGTLHFEGDEAQPGALARDRELVSVDERLTALEKRRATLEAEEGSVSDQLTEARERRAGLRQEVSDLQQKLAVAEARREDLTARQKRLSVEHHTLENERIETERNLGLVAERGDQLAAELERSEKLHDALEADFDRAQTEADAARSERENLRTSGASRRGRLELLQQRLETHHRERARIEGEIEETRSLIAGWDEERSALEDRDAEVSAEASRADEELQAALEDRVSIQERVLDGQQRLDVSRAELDKLETEVETRRVARDEVRAEIGELKVSRATLDSEIEHLAGRYRDELGEELPAEPGEIPPEIGELEDELERLKQQIERSGPVNLLAAEEYAEQEERHSFLTTQRADVAGSVESLRRTIREINQTSSQRFVETFLEVNESFGATYTQLFRGGQAEMRLLDEDDPLESGIEIVARPPGKRLQNIMLLSGGEKALTAIALLFALFKTKPSPFCILDEVDAPLDDLNTLRFVDMLKQMSHETQFILITHNKLTMEAATRLYGVTMQERGVSRLVSVELGELHPEDLAATA